MKVREKIWECGPSLSDERTSGFQGCQALVLLMTGLLLYGCTADGGVLQLLKVNKNGTILFIREVFGQYSPRKVREVKVRRENRSNAARWWKLVDVVEYQEDDVIMPVEQRRHNTFSFFSSFLKFLIKKVGFRFHLMTKAVINDHFYFSKNEHIRDVRFGNNAT